MTQFSFLLSLIFYANFNFCFDKIVIKVIRKCFLVAFCDIFLRISYFNLFSDVNIPFFVFYAVIYNFRLKFPTTLAQETVRCRFIFIFYIALFPKQK